MELTEDISARIRRAKAIRGMTSADIARATNLTEAAISFYVNGKNEPRQGTIILLARALGVSEAWLMGYDVPMDKVSWDDELDDLVGKLNEGQRQKVANFIKDYILK